MDQRRDALDAARVSSWSSRRSQSVRGAAPSARWAESSPSPASSPRSSRRRNASSTSATSTRTSWPGCSPKRSGRPTSTRGRGRRGRMAAGLEHRADPLRPGADRAGRRCDQGGRRHSHRLPSGPLHDAAEVSRAGVPTVMVFVQSLRGCRTRNWRTRGRSTSSSQCKRWTGSRRRRSSESRRPARRSAPTPRRRGRAPCRRCGRR